MPIPLVLRRRGSTSTLESAAHKLLTTGVGSDAPGFHLELREYRRGESWTIHLKIGDHTFDHPERHITNWQKALPRNLDEAMVMAEVMLMAGTHKEYAISRTPEAYYYNDEPPYQQLARCMYEEATDTIRTLPENYCLICWEDGDIRKPIFHLDAATADKPGIPEECQWRTVAKAAHDCFLAEHIRRDDPINSKRWLAWIASEYRKYGTSR